jgi:hypothetical protein
VAEERDRLAKVAKTCVDVGIEERRVRLAESAGQQLAAVIRSVLDQLELTDEQRVLALRVVPDELRRLAGDVVPGQVAGGGAARELNLRSARVLAAQLWLPAQHGEFESGPASDSSGAPRNLG